MKKALITGGAGFIGFHLANKLLSNHYKIDLLDNFSRGVNDRQLSILKENPKVRLLDKDLSTSSIIKELDQDYDYIFHLAAVIGVKHVLKAPYDVLVKNFVLLQNALKTATNQKKIKRFIFASTSEVYAGTLEFYGLDFPTIESTPLTVNELNEERTSYMLSKIYGEAMCLHSDLPVTIIRPHNFYGPRMGLSHVIPELMKKIIETKNGILDLYSPNHERTFSFITDAVEMIQLLAESDVTIGKSYNLGNEEEEITMYKLAQKIIDLIGKEIIINPLPDTPGSPVRRVPSIAKLKEAVNFVKVYSFEEGLEKTFEWYNKEIFLGNGASAL
jgi:UDP-glucose 4-epimerase